MRTHLNTLRGRQEVSGFQWNLVNIPQQRFLPMLVQQIVERFAEDTSDFRLLRLDDDGKPTPLTLPNRGRVVITLEVRFDGEEVPDDDDAA